MKHASLLLALPSLLLAACGGGSSDGAGGGTVSVVAASYPFAWVAEQVGGDLVTVQNLTSPGIEPHDIELKPKQVGAVQDADVVVYERSFQAAVDDAVDQADRSDDDTVDVASLVDRAREDEEAGHDHADEDGHDHGGLDPHVWTDPANMVVIVDAVAQRLADVDPDDAATYTANAEALTAELTALDADLTAGLETCERRTLVTSHAAFHYLADAYDLVQVPIAGLDPTNEPSPAQLAGISRLVREQGITTIFTEELVSPAIARTIASETGATTATLDPIEGLSDETSSETYLTLMRANLDAIRKANACT